MKRTSQSSRPSVVRIVAVTGCDGSGKSTLATALLDRLRKQGPVELVYLGQSSGRIAEWIGGLPLVGRVVARALKRKSAKVHAKTAKPLGPVTALAIYLLSGWRVHKFQRMLALCRRGVLVVTDRYPQTEVPGFHFDGPELATQPAQGWLVRRLAAREQHLYQWMADHVPALVIRLGVDADTAYARKPDHARSVLSEKIAVLPRLRFNGARILDLDGRESAQCVLESALDAVRTTVLQAPRA